MIWIFHCLFDLVFFFFAQEKIEKQGHCFYASLNSDFAKRRREKREISNCKLRKISSAYSDVKTVALLPLE